MSTAPRKHYIFRGATPRTPSNNSSPRGQKTSTQETHKKEQLRPENTTFFGALRHALPPTIQPTAKTNSGRKKSQSITQAQAAQPAAATVDVAASRKPTETTPRCPRNRGNCCGLLRAAKQLGKIVRKGFFAGYNPISLGIK